jgi:hypothetical protein
MCIEVLNLQECDSVSLSEYRDGGVIFRAKQSMKTLKMKELRSLETSGTTQREDVLSHKN